MSKKKKDNIIKLDNDFSFEELVQHIANVKAEDVDETMRQENEDASIEEDTDYSEPPEEC